MELPETFVIQMYSAMVFADLVWVLGLCGYLHISYYKYPNEKI
jgi:hypothetical protein